MGVRDTRTCDRDAALRASGWTFSRSAESHTVIQSMRKNSEGAKMISSAEPLRMNSSDHKHASDGCRRHFPFQNSPGRGRLLVRLIVAVTAIAGFWVHRLDQLAKVSPRNHPVHLRQE